MRHQHHLQAKTAALFFIIRFSIKPKLVEKAVLRAGINPAPTQKSVPWNVGAGFIPARLSFEDNRVTLFHNSYEKLSNMVKNITE